jgi:hypothetical protein
MALPDRARVAVWLLPALVAAVVLVLTVAGWYYLARRPTAPVRSTAVLVDAIAALDARYLGRQAETSLEDWASYQAERHRLKTELEAALAAGGPGQ